jgi:peptide/nickel transport system substrate-binding protein
LTKFNHKSKVATAIFAGTLLLTSGAQAETVLNTSITQDLRSTNPGVDRDGKTDSVLMHIVEGLVAYGADFAIEPSLAKSWTESEDGLTYTFELRDGVEFHNGETMTAKEVKWSWERLMNAETGWRCRGQFLNSDGEVAVQLEVVDDMTVKYTLQEPSATFLGNLARFDCGNAPILHPDSLSAEGEWVEPIGTGPFTLGDIKPGRYIDLLKNPNYSSRGGPSNGYAGGKEVSFDRVRLFVLPEAAVSKAAFLAGDIDVLALEAQDLIELEGAEGVEIVHSLTASWDTLLVNAQDPVLSDVRIRQAMAHAINRDQIVAVISEGRGESNPSPLPSVSAFYSDVQKEALPYDPEKAKALLAEAGYDGEPIVIMTNRRSGAFYERGLIAQSMLQEVGLNAELNVLEWGTQLEAYKSGKYQVQSFTYSPRLDPALSFEMFTGEQSRKAWKNPDAIEKVEKALRVTNKDERKALVDELHRAFIQEVPAISIGNRTQFYAVRDSIEGFTLWGAGKPIYWGVSYK